MSNFRLANSYLSSGVYDSIIDKNHFLCRLDTLFDWDDLALPLWDMARNEHGGRPRNNPVVLLKMIFLSFLLTFLTRILNFIPPLIYIVNTSCVCQSTRKPRTPVVYRDLEMKLLKLKVYLSLIHCLTTY